MQRSERLHAITEYLRRRRTPVTVSDLARHFEVDERTVFRDLASLRDQQVPILGEPGRGGGVQLDREYQIPPLALSVDEAVSLWLSYRLAAVLGTLPVGGCARVLFGSLRALSSGRGLREHRSAGNQGEICGRENGELAHEISRDAAGAGPIFV